MSNAVSSKYVGPGELERTGYIPDGSSEEREKCRVTEAEAEIGYRYIKEEEIAPLIAKLLDVRAMRKETKRADALRVAHNRAVRELRALINLP